MSSRHDLYVIEARKADGSLDFQYPQPEKFFGMSSITGISEYRMAEVILNHCPTAVLNGFEVLVWPKFLDGRFIARRKTW